MSLRDLFRADTSSIVHVDWDVELTIEDLIYVSIIGPGMVVLGPTFSEYIKHPCKEYWLGTVYISTPDNLRILLYLLINGSYHEEIQLLYEPGNDELPRSWVFDPSFLDKCWGLACKYKVEHQKFGNMIKKLKRGITQDFSEFEYWYLNGSGGYIKSAQN